MAKEVLEQARNRFFPKELWRWRRAVRQFVKYGLVGASGVIVNLVVFHIALRYLGFQPAIAATFSFIVAAASNFTWNRHWTFRRSAPPILSQAWKFGLVSIVSLLLNLLVLDMLLPVQAGGFALASGLLSGPIIEASLYLDALLTSLQVAWRPTLDTLQADLAQLAAIAIVTLFNFAANKLWSFH